MPHVTTAHAGRRRPVIGSFFEAHCRLCAPIGDTAHPPPRGYMTAPAARGPQPAGAAAEAEVLSIDFSGFDERLKAMARSAKEYQKQSGAPWVRWGGDGRTAGGGVMGGGGGEQGRVLCGGVMGRAGGGSAVRSLQTPHLSGRSFYGQTILRSPHSTDTKSLVDAPALITGNRPYDSRKSPHNAHHLPGTVVSPR